MIYSMGNMEYFEICEITPNIQCFNCMTYWPKGIGCCTCGTCLRPSHKVRKLNSDRYDVLSIPNYVIKKGPSHGRRHGKAENLPCRPCLFWKGIQEVIHINTGLILEMPFYRPSQLDIGWIEDHCARLDETAAENHSCIATAAERAHLGSRA